MKHLAERLRGLIRPSRVRPDSQAQQPSGAVAVTTSQPVQPTGGRWSEVQGLLDSDKGAEALKLVQQLLTEAPRIPGSRFLLGVCLDRVGRHEEALAAYQDELTDNPTHAQAGQRVKLLSEALARPASAKTHWQQRSWQTSLPRETLLSIQHSLHNYTYRGLAMLKNPFDCALYPLLLWKLQPRTIFEIGSKDGGSALWFGDLLESFHIDGHVYSLDIVKPKGVSHGRVTFQIGRAHV